jgi:hypothetical protein
MQPARLLRLADQYDNPLPQSGTKNLAYDCPSPWAVLFLKTNFTIELLYALLYYIAMESSFHLTASNLFTLNLKDHILYVYCTVYTNFVTII